MGIAAAGMRAAENQVSATAERIVRLASTTPSAPVQPAMATQSASPQATPAAVPSAELTEEMVNLKQAELGFRAGLRTFRAAEKMARHALDILT